MDEIGRQFHEIMGRIFTPAEQTSHIEHAHLHNEDNAHTNWYSRVRNTWETDSQMMDMIDNTHLRLSDFHRQVERHMLPHHKDPNQCPMCSEKFSFPERLKQDGILDDE